MRLQGKVDVSSISHNHQQRKLFEALKGKTKQFKHVVGMFLSQQDLWGTQDTVQQSAEAC